jgi:uncharacterized protein
VAHPSKSCGECTLCCKTMPVEEVSKPEGKWCTHCKVGKGCGIYATRPQPCIDFECFWLQSPPEAMGDDLRPDRCGVVFTAGMGGDGVVALCDASRPTIWRNPAVLRVLRAAAQAGAFAAAKAGKRFWAIGTRGEYEVPTDRLIPETETLTMVTVPARIADEIGFKGRHVL